MEWYELRLIARCGVASGEFLGRLAEHRDELGRLLDLTRTAVAQQHLPGRPEVCHHCAHRCRVVVMVGNRAIGEERCEVASTSNDGVEAIDQLVARLRRSFGRDDVGQQLCGFFDDTFEPILNGRMGHRVAGWLDMDQHGVEIHVPVAHKQSIRCNGVLARSGELEVAGIRKRQHLPIFDGFADGAHRGGIEVALLAPITADGECARGDGPFGVGQEHTHLA